jgi:hypothetical protein
MATPVENRSFGEKVAWTSRTVFALGAVALAGAAIIAPVPAAAEAFTDAAIGFGILALISEGLRESASNQHK